MLRNDDYEAFYQNCEMCGPWIRAQSGQFCYILKFQNNYVFQIMLERLQTVQRNAIVHFSTYRLEYS